MDLYRPTFLRTQGQILDRKSGISYDVLGTVSHTNSQIMYTSYK